MMYLNVQFLLLCVVPLPDTPCGTCTGSCEHYEQRVEPLLQCGDDGFALAFGRQHCEVIQELRSNATMPPWMLEWLLSHEICLQQKVLELATARTCPTPNPVSCLQFEAMALVAFEECFTRNVSLLCDSNEISSDLAALAYQVGNLTDKLGINDYYRREVLEAVTRAINTCHHPNISHVVDTVRPTSRDRLVFCAIVSGRDDVQNFPVTSFVDTIAAELRRPVEQFNYAGRAQEFCQENRPPALGNIEDLIFHYVTWEPDNGDELLQELQSSYVVPVSTTSFFDFYELQDLRSYGHCGDGERQAGELCDTGISNFFGLGCNSSCMPRDQYECDTIRLVQSTCHLTVCGDGLTTSNEECDIGYDLLTSEGTGCADCRIATGYECNNTYNGTSTCWHVPTVPPTTSTATPSTTSQDTMTTSHTIAHTTGGTRTRTPPSLEPDPIGSGSAAPLNYFSYSVLFSVSLVLLISL